jgi:hypothetical protein
MFALAGQSFLEGWQRPAQGKSQPEQLARHEPSYIRLP